MPWGFYNLILIFSLSRDQGTNGVVQWLDRLGVPFVRVNEDEPGRPQVRIALQNDDFSVEVEGRRYASSEITAIWYRKGNFWIPSATPAPVFPGEEELTRLVERKLKAEAKRAAEFFHHLVRDRGVRVLGNAILGDPNKLIVLHLAQRAGLKVPRFDVVERLEARHLAEPARFVTKALSDGIYLWDNDHAHRGYFTYTEALGDVPGLPADGDAAPLSLIQEKVAKRFELRIFYLEGLFFGTAIYSQENSQTAVDYRKYDAETPNRMVPFEVPAGLRSKLRRLFDDLELNTGSVDMIVDEEGEFVFLEINPVGIYGGLAYVCNYNIDETIARWLCGEKVDEGTLVRRADAGADTVAAARIQDHLLQGSAGVGT
jgi:ATP-GRASP peptide maturase of grasp-with-spasm system